MKLNIKLSIAAAAIALATTANAGVAGVNFGLGGGQLMSDDPSGIYSDGMNPAVDLTDTLGLEGGDNYYGWAYFEHPVPVLPNIKLEMGKDEYSGTRTINQTILGNTFTGSVDSTMDLSSQDLILYWGVPGTGVLSTAMPLVGFDMDFGLGAKQYKGEIAVTESTGTTSYMSEIDEIIPYGYLRARVEAFGVGVEGQFKYTSYESNTYQDCVVKADYTFPVTPVIDIGIEGGYKQTKFDVDFSGFVADAETSGYFVGVFAKF